MKNIILFIVVINALIFYPYQVNGINSLSYSINEHNKDNWAIEINNTVTQLDQDTSKLIIAYSVSYFQDTFFSSKFSGVYINIGSNSTILADETYGINVLNKTMLKGTSLTSFTFIFYKLGTNASKYTGNNVKLVPVSKNGIYTITIANDPELASFNGTLKISFNPISITLNPSSWYVTGYYNESASKSMTTSSNLFFIMIFLVVGLVIFVIGSIVFISSKKLKKNRTSQNNKLDFISNFKNRIKIYSNGNTKQKNTVSDKTLDTILDIIEENQSTNYSDETKRKSC